MREIVRMVAVLALVSMVAGGALTIVYNATAAKIEQNKQAELARMILEVIPGATDSAPAELALAADTIQVYKGLDQDGRQVGLAIVASGPGFQGEIKLIAGLDIEKEQLTAVRVLEHLETPGLGSQIAEEDFLSQFAGKPLSDPFVAKQDVEAITGATISSRAVSVILQKATREVLQAMR